NHALVRMRRFVLLFVLAAVFPLSAGRSDDADSPEKVHAEVVVPFLQKHCWRCHDDGPKVPPEAADVVLLPLADKRGLDGERALWKRVQKKVANRQMPPEEEPQPSAAERERFLAWCERARAVTADPGRVVLPRLNRAEYDYTVQDLLHVKPLPAD